jgi:hypothetical protein
MQLVKYLSFILFITYHCYANDLTLVITSGSSKVKPLNKDSVVMNANVKLNTLDYISTNLGSISGIKEKNNILVQIGEKSDIMIDRNDKTGWRKFYLTRGSLRVYTGKEPIVIKTPTSEIVTFDGILDVHVIKGVTLIAPRKGKGGMVYCDDSVNEITIENIAHVNQNGVYHKHPLLAAKYTFLMGDNVTKEISESKSLTQPYRIDFYKRLNIGWKSRADQDIPSEIQDIIVHELNFDSEIIALESSVKLYDHYSDQGDLIRKGSKLLFAQKLFSSENNNELIPSDLFKYFNESELTDVFKIKIEIANNSLNRLSPIQKNFVLHFFRQEMIEKLRPKHKVKERLKFDFREIVVYNTNVTQTPEEDIAVSDTEDISSNTSFNLSYSARPGNKGVLIGNLKYTEIGYFKKSNQTREFSNIAFKLKNKFTFKKKAKLSNFSPSIQYKLDYLNTIQGKYLAFETLDVQLEMILKPFQGKGRFSDLGLLFLSLGFEDRSYKGSDVLRLDSLGREKDTFTPKFVLFYMTMKSFKYFTSKFTNVLNYRNAKSNSKDLEYNNIRYDASFNMIFPIWTISPAFAFSQRDQDSYRTQSRKDKIYEYSIGVKRPIFNKKGSFGLTLKSIDQSSNVTDKNYTNNQFSALFSYKF